MISSALDIIQPTVTKLLESLQFTHQAQMMQYPVSSIGLYSHSAALANRPLFIDSRSAVNTIH